MMMTSETRKSLIDWLPFHERLQCVRLRGRYANLSIIAVYAPTSEANVDVKDFYSHLQCLVDKTALQDILILGDLNAQVGSCNVDLKRVLGQNGCGVLNENGQHLVDFCTMNKLIVGNTLFRHKDIHKKT